jgi:GNAT superfamily N-acetyltransferase
MENAFNISFKIAQSNEQFADGAQLFREYASSLPIDLAFQGFDHELTIIPVQYNQPVGALILAYHQNQAIGCAGVRKLENDIAELKRMYVRPAYRGHKIAQQLLQLAIDQARMLHYKAMRLDTIPGMTSAYNLYRTNGFYEIEPYRFNPVAGAIYMEKQL